MIFTHRRAIFAASLLALSATAGCNDKKSSKGGPPAHRGAAPPPTASAKGAKLCAKGGGTVKDPVASGFFPKMAGTYCVNPAGETRSFGEKAAKPIGGICSIFDGGCQQYQNHKVIRTVVVDYVDGGGSPGTITVKLSKFKSNLHAYAMFTERVTSGDDPARKDMPKPLKSASLAAIGTGAVYGWKGAYLLELDYVNTDESGDAKKLKASGEKVLPPVAAGILGKLPGSTKPPAAAGLLPTAERLPLGRLFVTEKLLGQKDAGGGAVGFYSKGGKRFRVLAITKEDTDQAKDILKTFRKAKGASKLKGVGEGAARLMVQDEADGPKQEWLVARKGKVLFGVGDEAFALKAAAAADKIAKVSLSKAEKTKYLQSLLKGVK